MGKFLSGSECDNKIEIVVEFGWLDSTVKGHLTNLPTFVQLMFFNTQTVI
jgi:hypothetical protein